jgi:chromosome segregation ATPase
VIERMRQDLDKWENKLANWKETLVRKAKELDRRKEAVNEYIEQRESRAADLLKKLTSERDALRVEKETLRKARHAAESEFQEQMSLLRYRRKELTEIQSKCKEQLEQCERKEGELVEQEKALECLKEEVFPAKEGLDDRVKKVIDATS